jgi:hypothetical protein
MAKAEGQIYLIKTREFINNRENVFKVGRTSCIKKRLASYPKGSKCLCAFYCRDMVVTETMVLQAFRRQFTHRVEYGKEYFEGDPSMMARLILKIITEGLNFVDFFEGEWADISEEETPGADVKQEHETPGAVVKQEHEEHAIAKQEHETPGGCSNISLLEIEGIQTPEGSEVKSQYYIITGKLESHFCATAEQNTNVPENCRQICKQPALWESFDQTENSAERSIKYVNCTCGARNLFAEFHAILIDNVLISKEVLDTAPAAIYFSNDKTKFEVRNTNGKTIRGERLANDFQKKWFVPLKFKWGSQPGENFNAKNYIRSVRDYVLKNGIPEDLLEGLFLNFPSTEPCPGLSQYIASHKVEAATPIKCHVLAKEASSSLSCTINSQDVRDWAYFNHNRGVRMEKIGKFYAIKFDASRL